MALNKQTNYNDKSAARYQAVVAAQSAHTEIHVHIEDKGHESQHEHTWTKALRA